MPYKLICASQEEEEEEEKEEVVEEPAKEEDAEYWQRVLGSAYEEHQMQLFREQEELAASLGKGKRVRRKVSRCFWQAKDLS